MLSSENSLYHSISKHSDPDFTQERKHHLVFDADSFFLVLFNWKIKKRSGFCINRWLPKFHEGRVISNRDIRKTDLDITLNKGYHTECRRSVRTKSDTIHEQFLVRKPHNCLVFKEILLKL